MRESREFVCACFPLNHCELFDCSSGVKHKWRCRGNIHLKITPTVAFSTTRLQSEHTNMVSIVHQHWWKTRKWKWNLVQSLKSLQGHAADLQCLGAADSTWQTFTNLCVCSRKTLQLTQWFCVCAGAKVKWVTACAWLLYSLQSSYSWLREWEGWQRLDGDPFNERKCDVNGMHVYKQIFQLRCFQFCDSYMAEPRLHSPADD